MSIVADASVVLAWFFETAEAPDVHPGLRVEGAWVHYDSYNL